MHTPKIYFSPNIGFIMNSCYKGLIEVANQVNGKKIMTLYDGIYTIIKLDIFKTCSRRVHNFRI